ncbi:exopolysaccharide biosynthesis protein [Agrobacterium rubi]|uniref:exopolysaccharide biosynthesis protein n=1 Tax=Agrobacterium rubi TaxID=28099 RepID=UPI00201B88DF|nr:exopolysaccharide biosynthesis protein [Agrobacterium rubi]MCL6654799.1 exopolysaccharide biosynthesis protein [Agrobacterium rubi]
MTENSTADRPVSSGVASAALTSIAALARLRGNLSLGEVMATMGPAGMAFAILVLALPALTPVPGPIGLVFGTALAVVAAQIAVGRSSVWLPKFLSDRRLSSNVLELVVRHTAPHVSRVERLVRADRLKFLTGPFAQMLIGLPIMVMAVAIALPIPLGNFLPVISLVILAIGLMERDGLITLLGVILSVIAAGVTGFLIYGAASVIGGVAR